MKLLKILIFSVLTLVIFSCEKDETVEESDIYGKWTVTDLMSVESVGYFKKDEFNPVIEIKKDGSYHLKLNVNNCIGDFTLYTNNQISLSPAGCTKICCDSEFSNKLVLMLPKVKTYRLEKNKLTLEVPEWGWISLEGLK